MMAIGSERWRAWSGHALWLVCTLLFTLVGAEIAVRALDLFPVPRDFSRGSTEGEDGNTSPEEQAQAEQPLSLRVPHPYLGWVHRPGRGRINDWGFPSAHSDYRQLEEEDFVVAVAGGSVALGVAVLGSEGIVEGIVEHHPELEGRVRLVNLALGGYKQPQQYFAVSQALLLETPLDAVINLDGFNEAALGTVDAKRRFHPIFPRQAYWIQASTFAGSELTAEEIEATAAALRHRRWIGQSIQLLTNSWLGRSELVRAWFGSRMLKTQGLAVAAEKKLAEEAGGEGQEFQGPVVPRALQEECFGAETCDDEIVRLWKQSSKLLAELCRSRGIAYLHALQPNQYVAPAKELTEEELAKAWSPDDPWSRTVVRLFPELRRVGEEELRPAGIDFLDLTALFEAETGTVYIDTCCHFNQQGYTEIGRALGARLAQNLPEP